MKNWGKLNLIQKLAWIYAANFIFVVLIGHVPGLANEQGRLFGVYNVSLFVDVGHSIAGILGIIAVWHSVAWSVYYFRLVGFTYGSDFVISLLFNRDLTETGSIFTGIGSPNFTLGNIIANLPHIIISSLALWIGFYLHKRVAGRKKSK